MNINAPWHLKNKMPKNPTMDQRIKWHLGHVRYCSCRSLDGTILKEFEKRFTGRHQEFWIYFDREDHKKLGLWAAMVAEKVLPYFEKNYPGNDKPRKAIEALSYWIRTGDFSMKVIRKASLDAHEAARMTEYGSPGYNAARAAGQAVATAHVPTHALGAYIYAMRAIRSSDPEYFKNKKEESSWMMEGLEPELKKWVAEKLQKLKTFG